MSIEELALELPRLDKLRLMEALWKDLSEDGEGLDSPAWHEGVLKEMESRLESGAEAMVDWGEAKRRLSAGR